MIRREDVPFLRQYNELNPVAHPHLQHQLPTQLLTGLRLGLISDHTYIIIMRLSPLYLFHRNKNSATWDMEPIIRSIPASVR